MTKLGELKKHWMADPEFRAAYEAADREFAVVEAEIRATTARLTTLPAPNDSQIVPRPKRKD